MKKVVPWFGFIQEIRRNIFLLKNGRGYAPIEKVELLTQNTRDTLFFGFGNKNAFVDGLAQKPQKINVTYVFGEQFEVMLNKKRKDNLVFIMADPKFRALLENAVYFHTSWS